MPKRQTTRQRHNSSTSRLDGCWLVQNYTWCFRSTGTMEAKRRRLAQDENGLAADAVDSHGSSVTRRKSNSNSNSTSRSTHRIMVATPHNNQTLASSFSLQVEPIKSLHNQSTSTPVTIALLVVIHLLFFYQWNARTKRRDILVSYRTLVEKKHYHKAVLAFLSHPPTKPRQNQNTNTNSSPTSPSLSLSLTENSSRGRRCFLLARDWIRFRSSSLTNGRHLSGLPLLFYNAHILWSCRALEMESETPWGYARLLLGITMVGVAAELYLTHYLLQVLEYRNHATSTPIMIAMTSRRRRRSRQQSTLLAQHHDQIVTHRTMGSLTLTTCALLLVFRYRFPDAALQVLPFLSSRVFLLDDPGLSYLFSTMILTGLSFGTHPVAGVLCGTFSGWLWGVGMTSFFQEGYWASGLMFMYAFLCLLSLKVSGSRWIPCIDSVGWDSRGNILEESVPLEFQNPEHDGRGGPDGESDDDDDGDDDDSTSHSLEDQDATAHDDLEMGLLTGRRTHSNDSLHHRLPVMNDMDDDDNDGDDNDNDNDERRPMLSTSTTMRSRRNTSRSDLQ
jgi:hypothetical protein